IGGRPHLWGVGSPYCLGQSKLHRAPHRVPAGAGVELREDRRQVVVHRLFGEKQPACDLAVPQPVCDQPEDLELAFGEVGGVLWCRRAGTARKPASAPLTEALRDGPGGGDRTQPLEFFEGTALRLVTVPTGKRQGGVVRAVELIEQIRSSLPLAGDLQGI